MALALESPALRCVGGAVAQAAKPIDGHVREGAGAVDAASLVRILGLVAAEAEGVVSLFCGGAPRPSDVSVDGFEVMATAGLCCKASPAAKAKLLFEMFDMDGNGSIALDELIVMLKCVLLGVAHVTDGRPVPLPALKAFADAAFRSADLVADGKLTYVEFSAWVRESNEARAIIRLFPASGRPLLPWASRARGEPQMSPPRELSPRSRMRGVDGIIKQLEDASEEGSGAGRGPGGGRRARAGRARGGRGRGSPPGSGLAPSRAPPAAAVAAPAAGGGISLKYTMSTRGMSSRYQAQVLRATERTSGEDADWEAELEAAEPLGPPAEAPAPARAPGDVAAAAGAAGSATPPGGGGQRPKLGDPARGRGGIRAQRRGGSSRSMLSSQAAPRRDVLFTGKFHKHEVLAMVDKFKRMDDDGSGAVSVLEFAREMGGDFSVSSAMFQTMDKDNSGEITLDELLRLWFSGASPQEWRQIEVWAGLVKSSDDEESEHDSGASLTEEQTAELRAIFDSYDTDRNGSVTIQELLRGLTDSGTVSEEEARTLFAQADVDESGALDFEEFAELMDHFFTDAVSALMSTYSSRKEAELSGEAEKTAAQKNKIKKRRPLGIQA